MLRLIYCGKVFNLNKLAYESIQAAEKYNVHQLKKICEAELIRSISVGNCIEYYVLADKINANDLEEKAIELVTKNRKILLTYINKLLNKDLVCKLYNNLCR